VPGNGYCFVAVYSEADKEALFAKYADEAYCIGPPPATASYLNIQKVIEVARETGLTQFIPVTASCRESEICPCL